MDDPRLEISNARKPLPPQERIGFLLYRAGLAISRGYERALNGTGTTPSEAGVLSALAYSGATHLRALGRLLGLSRTTLVNVARRMEKSGLITRDSDPADSRVSTLRITATGRKRLAAVEVVAGAFDDKLSGVIGQADERRMTLALKRILETQDFAHLD